MVEYLLNLDALSANIDSAPISPFSSRIKAIFEYVNTKGYDMKAKDLDKISYKDIDKLQEEVSELLNNEVFGNDILDMSKVQNFYEYLEATEPIRTENSNDLF